MSKACRTWRRAEECVRVRVLVTVVTIATIHIAVRSKPIRCSLIVAGWTSWFVVNGRRHLLDSRRSRKSANHWPVGVVMGRRWAMYADNTVLGVVRSLTTATARGSCRGAAVHCFVVGHFVNFWVLVVVFCIGICKWNRTNKHKQSKIWQKKTQ